MKKLIAIFISLLLTLPAFTLEYVDPDTMTPEELIVAINEMVEEIKYEILSIQDGILRKMFNNYYNGHLLLYLTRTTEYYSIPELLESDVQSIKVGYKDQLYEIQFKKNVNKRIYNTIIKEFTQINVGNTILVYLCGSNIKNLEKTQEYCRNVLTLFLDGYVFIDESNHYTDYDYNKMFNRDKLYDLMND